MQWEDIKKGMKFTRAATNSMAACRGEVVYASDVFKIVRTDEGKEMSVSKSGHDLAIYTFNRKVENK